jgi:nephrocystin-3
MRRLMVAIVRWCDDWSGGFGLEDERIPVQTDEIVKVFPQYLGRLAYHARQKGVRALIALDALNQLEDREHGRLLGWLPYLMSLDVRLIVSTLPGDTLGALAPRAWPSLTVKTLLDDLRATGIDRELDRQIGDYLQAPDIPTLLVKIIARYEHDYDRDRPGLVREALSLVWAARRGLTEAELLRCLRPDRLPQLPLAVWTPLRLAMDEGLTDRDGILGFGHAFIRDEAETLLGRALVGYARISRDIKRRHPGREPTLSDYLGLLRKRGYTDRQIQTKIHDLDPEVF